MSMVEFVCATRRSEEEFWTQSALGLSLIRMSFDRRILPRVAVSNTYGLPDIYNHSLDDETGPDIQIFIHDDVWLMDHFLVDRVLEGLQHCDVLGVAGVRQRVPGQPAWCFSDTELTPIDQALKAGSVAHSEEPFGRITHFGDCPAECELMDGVFLATRKSVLKRAGVRFDPQFDFHFYDMDFCRAARQRGLKLMAWPIALTHQSKGSYISSHWREKYEAYLRKWGE
jgi:GT2 family glycosyltransferase